MYSDEEIKKMFENIAKGMNEMYSVVKSTTGNLNISSQNLVELSNEVRGLNSSVLNLKGQVGQVTQEITKLSKTVNSIDERMNIIENKEEIETSQIDELYWKVSERVKELIGEYNSVIRARYTGDFRKQLWWDAKQAGLCGHRISMTKKEKFDDLIAYVNAWVPDIGVAKLKEKIAKKWKVNHGFDINKIGVC